MNLVLVLLLLLGVRIASVFVVQTYYVADEFWQSLEVAHKLTFGYGYLTWEWVQGLRSYLYPLVIAGVYKLLELLNLDSVQLLVIVPRLLQAILSAYSDYRFFVWSGKKKWSLFLIVVPWFWFYTGSRTLSNTLETSLITIGLSYFPWRGEGTAYLWLAAFSCFLRPTAAIIWLPLCIHHLRESRVPILQLILKRFVLIGVVVAALCVAIDSFLHGSLIITPYEFLKYNIFHNIGAFYGSHPWYWYFTVGLPTVLGINFLPFLFGISETVRNHKDFPVRKHLLITILTSLVLLSAVEHKEFRFVTSLLPLCLYISADALTRWSYSASKTMLWVAALAIVAGNAFPAWYLSTVHQKGPMELMPKLRDIARNYRDENGHRAKILFLMPCHSTPYYSHIHENVTMRFLTCEPNLQNAPNYKDEAERFYNAPDSWLRSHIPVYPRTALPSHVVLFEPLAELIHEFLSKYRMVHRIENQQVNQNVEAQSILAQWTRLIKEQKLDMDKFLENVRPKGGKNILVYQRLRADEENAFNREDSVEPPPAKTRNERQFENTDSGEKNLFN